MARITNFAGLEYIVVELKIYVPSHIVIKVRFRCHWILLVHWKRNSLRRLLVDKVPREPNRLFGPSNTCAEQPDHCYYSTFLQCTVSRFNSSSYVFYKGHVNAGIILTQITNIPRKVFCKIVLMLNQCKIIPIIKFVQHSSTTNA